MQDNTNSRGLTPNELAKVLRVSPDRVRNWIIRGELGAVNVGDTMSGKPRYVVLPHHLAEFTRQRTAGAPAKPARRRKRPQDSNFINYFPD
jgi:excisionase family DNA binding protein